MVHITAKKLAEKLDLESESELFELMIEDFKANNTIAARANFNILRAANQRQFLKYCDRHDEFEALKFFHSLI